MNTIEINNTYEGANPFDINEINRINAHSIKVMPFCEDEMIAYKFRLDLNIINHSEQSQKLKLFIDWKDQVYNHLRDVLYLKSNGDNWRTVSGIVNGQTVTVSVELPPGESHMTLNPKYDPNDLTKYLSSITKYQHLAQRVIGTTLQNRPIWVIRSGKGEKTVLISARVHPYETAPSFIIEGIIDFLISSIDSSLLNDFNFVVIPMMCPDGVAEGCCRVSQRLNGVDLSREINEDDPLTQYYIELIDEIRPVLYLELHNWMFKDIDGMFYLNRYASYRFKKSLINRMSPSFGKKWRIGIKFPFRALEPGGLKSYCKKTYKSKVVTLEIPWFGRSPSDMREFGRIIPLALGDIL